MARLPSQSVASLLLLHKTPVPRLLHYSACKLRSHQLPTFLLAVSRLVPTHNLQSRPQGASQLQHSKGELLGLSMIDHNAKLVLSHPNGTRKAACIRVAPHNNYKSYHRKWNGNAVPRPGSLFSPFPALVFYDSPVPRFLYSYERKT